MPVEPAVIVAMSKPWGRADLRPWSDMHDEPEVTGELWFTRPHVAGTKSGLLFKLIFADQPLSIQVHPDDAFAQTRGLPNGKAEAWYILSAAAGARVAVGLKQRVGPGQLRAAIADGSIESLVAWRSVVAGDVIMIPAGTIHAIGAGVVLAEIQQNSDTTFRLYDFGRGRELHVDDAIAVADAGPIDSDATHRSIDGVRDILVENPNFILERIDLAPHSRWSISATRETLLFALAGTVAVGLVRIKKGQAAFVSAGDCACIETGNDGLAALLSYAGPDPVAGLLTQVFEVPDALLPALSGAGYA